MLVDYIEKNGACNWRQLPNRAGLNRCGKSCRLRWINYLRPDIKRGMFSEEEESLIIHFHSVLGNKWSQMAAQLPGRTDNEIKNYWNTHLRKKLLRNGIDPVTHRRRTDLNPLANLLDLVAAAANSNNFAPVPLAGAIQLQKLQLVHTLIQLMTSSLSPPNMDALHLLGFPFAFQNLNQPSSDFHDFHNTSQALLGSLNYVESGVGATTSTSNTTDTNSSFMCVPPMNVMPSLVHNSPENFSVNQASDVVNVAANVSSESSPFESWSRLSLDDLNIEFGWKDILEHISWLNPLEQQMETLKK